ncbi:hypothetical protein PISMIDRAFT_683542 [Pisolithus microcarpus 441]|uniref:Unplaced genomic scaffold scaffold_109, whole genome shotgun sequence n=1 Tax=Pisolithus microcarpus 441 TaxID=765257 RepID=A0A0C9ZGD0_9AGAM|nr:hypothetical protein PISMIDRAFT_688352 [Pisolithus microcarpus 441]KIK19003.1 hypothetical protein PISMIDRAFT_683542 [Pisolithus microcarpus 441]
MVVLCENTTCTFHSSSALRIPVLSFNERTLILWQSIVEALCLAAKNLGHRAPDCSSP